MTTTISASSLKVGDVIQVNAQAVWRVDQISATAKSIAVKATYTRCDFAPARVGQQWSHAYRAATKLTVV